MSSPFLPPPFLWRTGAVFLQNILSRGREEGTGEDCGERQGGRGEDSNGMEAEETLARFSSSPAAKEEDKKLEVGLETRLLLLLAVVLSEEGRGT